MAYVIKTKKSEVELPYLPKNGILKNGIAVTLDWYKEADERELFEILRYIVHEEGDSYPQDEMSTLEDFRSYYLSHDVFVCKIITTGELIGGFYVKPNFPGRCSHICNAGFIVKASSRGYGAGTFMAEAYLQIARDLGYLGSFFNLVFVSNESSVKLWRKLGFTEIGRVPKAGKLKGRDMTDALQFYYDLTTLPKLIME
ncbi:uncharacterized protein LOC127708049 [Mytilus californianus]|uniref:uncharacterized protein LOC127708049 n=1 Tax=Mytilus californianus TaxID=6549 RepID=UPI00224565A4|nr:uncharacterized protein LOC127708049 [Mytilus californianus]